MKKIKTTPFVPNEVKVEEVSENRAKIIAFPFESGYAITLAHPLRRLLLGSSVGYAPISIKIEGAAHEFDSIRGMKEDIAQFIINLKNIRFKIKDDLDRAVVSYSFKGPMEIKSSDLVNDKVDVIKEDIVVASLNEDGELNFTLEITKGLGYVPSEELREEVAAGAIALDAFFTPVKRATYQIENVLVEDNPNYERIVFDIETDGQITPVDAFKNALEVMSKQLSVFGNIFDLDLDSVKGGDSAKANELKPFLIPIDTLGLSVRSYNSLDRAGIKYLGELVLMKESEIKNIKNLGKKSFDEIKEMLAKHGFGEDFEISPELEKALRAKLEELKA
ncbi:MAG: DNA-directed RNA polymerase subunit alpha [Epsilonproteobacteria bacterium]|jgi:DNA-directed RNA polymerase subunit alpha|nr:DNA-directed RNA polymerase subunit alpha [Campylobacterota bacterium]